MEGEQPYLDLSTKTMVINHVSESPWEPILQVATFRRMGFASSNSDHQEFLGTKNKVTWNAAGETPFFLKAVSIDTA